MRLSNHQNRILNHLLDQYEKSATFQGKNKVRQSFSIRPGKLFPKYLDDAEYDFFVLLNEEMRELEKNQLIQIFQERGRIEKVTLDTDYLKDAYQFLERVPRDAWQEQILTFLDTQEEKIKEVVEEGELAEQVSELKNVYEKYIEAQKARIAENKSVEYMDDMADYKDLWTILFALFELENDVYIRDLSVKLFSDSKRLEQIKSRAEGLLYKYGEYPEKNLILEEYGLIQTPSYVMVKGNVILHFHDQELNVGMLRGDLAFSTESLRDITKIQVKGSRVITIENLTSFHRFNCSEDEVAIYLGGYHNRVKRAFLKSMYRDNPSVEYRHFGDIDAGGFYIFEHLKRKTGIPFRTIYMDMDTFCRYKKYTKELTPNDRKRIQKLIEKRQSGNETEYLEVLSTMLKMGRKLEQEAIQ